ncbi:MAG: type II toxin-antitoxin system VapB family antitoxin [Chloroflexi bacterium]|nr:type II toxin-antitoxin system VapB family antitoxin [Chloroflexota bacterium]
MRTTVRIDEQLLKEAKQLAIRSGKTLTAVIEDALRESLSRQFGSERREWVSVPTFGGKGLLPGVDLDDSASLLEVMESSNDPH